MTKKNPEDNRDDQLEQLQVEISTMRIQMMGQMALVQNLARGQEELRILINKLHQDRYDCMGQTARIWGLINDQPLLAGRESVDMFMREHVENKLKSSEIQGTASYNGKKESSIMYDPKNHNKSDLNQSVGAVQISNQAPVQQQRQGNQCKQDTPKRKFTKINMSSVQVLQHMLRLELITLKDPPHYPNTSSPRYNPNVRCANHTNSPRH